MAVERPVGLCAGRPNGRPFTRIQNPEMDAGLVDGQGHQAAERVDFFRQVALADAADGRVAAHLPDGLEALRQQQRARTTAGGSRSGFRTGVSAADHNDVKVLIHRTIQSGIRAGILNPRSRCREPRRNQSPLGPGGLPKPAFSTVKSPGSTTPLPFRS